MQAYRLPELHCYEVCDETGRYVCSATISSKDSLTYFTVVLTDIGEYIFENDKWTEVDSDEDNIADDVREILECLRVKHIDDVVQLPTHVIQQETIQGWITLSSSMFSCFFNNIDDAKAGLELLKSSLPAEMKDTVRIASVLYQPLT